VPVAYSGQFYTLRQHVEFVRGLIADRYKRHSSDAATTPPRAQ
jgi:hypothetical protein